MNAYERKFLLDDVLWTDSARPFFNEDSEQVKSGNAESAQECTPVTSNELKCTVCKADIGDNREAFVSHYRTDWHRFNLRRFMRKKSPVDEATFEEILSEGELSDHSEDEDAPNSAEATARGVLNGCREYFRMGGRVLSIYKAIQAEGQKFNDVFDRPMTCAIFMLTGGHFAAGVFHGGELIAHKTFHRYVVRAKQGGVQSVMDNRNGAAHSAGSNMRRQNEKMLKEDIGELIKSWKDDFLHPATMPLIFIRCSTYNLNVFVSATASATTFLKGDKRIRSVPFETKRAALDEVKRVYQQLRTVNDHGSVEAFEKRLDEEVKKRQKKLQGQLQRKTKQKQRDYEDEREESDSAEEREFPIRAMIKNAVGAVKKLSVEPKKFDGISDELIKRIYDAVCNNSSSELNLIEELFPGEQQTQYFTFIRDYRIPPLGNTFLHIAASKGAHLVVKWLLDVGCSPSEANNAGGYPIQLAANKLIVAEFVAFRENNPNACDWEKCRIPEPKKVDPEVEKRRAEKKRLDRTKKKEKQKVKKQAEAQEKAEQEERERFLNLSDREKRAEAAERRIAAMKAARVLEQQQGIRCFQCGEPFSTTPFEYNDNKFCKVACLHEHRRSHS